MQPIITVIICTHNPRFSYLTRVIKALKHQTLPFEKWELIVVDNASDRPLETEVDISWHPYGRHIREDQLGLTFARICGIKESRGENLIFVDDDNVLEHDYLQAALKISEDFPLIGSWSGQALPEFETPPEDWTTPYWSRLVIREVKEDKWSNLLFVEETTPYGAGLCVRSPVAKKYIEVLAGEPKRAKLGRTGKVLFSGEDVDLAYTSCDMGLGTGVFSNLKLTHLIPESRLKEEYLLKLTEGVAYSGIILDAFRGKLPIDTSWKRRMVEYFRSLFLTSRERRFKKAYARGVELGKKEIQGILQSCT